MKKIIPLLLILTVLLTAFSGCKKSEEVKQCEELISQLGDITLDSLEAIEKAEKAYGMLSGEDKGDVKNFNKLTEARKEYNGLKSFSDAVNEFTTLIDRVFRDYSVTADAVCTAFDELNAKLEQAPKKSADKYNSLYTPAKEKFDAYELSCQNVIPSAAVYVKCFLEEKGTDVTIDKVGCVAQLDGDTLYYIFALSYQENGEAKNVYATARFTDTPSKESILKYKDSFYADKPLSGNLNALENANVRLDTAAVLEEASK